MCTPWVTAPQSGLILRGPQPTRGSEVGGHRANSDENSFIRRPAGRSAPLAHESHRHELAEVVQWVVRVRVSRDLRTSRHSDRRELGRETRMLSVSLHGRTPRPILPADVSPGAAGTGHPSTSVHRPAPWPEPRGWCGHDSGICFRHLPPNRQLGPIQTAPVAAGVRHAPWRDPCCPRRRGVRAIHVGTDWTSICPAQGGGGRNRTAVGGLCRDESEVRHGSAQSTSPGQRTCWSGGIQSGFAPRVASGWHQRPALKSPRSSRRGRVAAEW